MNGTPLAPLILGNLPPLQSHFYKKKTIIAKNKLNLIQLIPPDEDSPVENCSGT